MEPMEELRVRLNDEYIEAQKGKGEGKIIQFSPEEREASRERYLKFSQTESEIEASVRKGRVFAATTPSVPLTF
jgi:hypothetical protein